MALEPASAGLGAKRFHGPPPSAARSGGPPIAQPLRCGAMTEDDYGGYPGSWRSLAERRRLWAAKLGMSEPQVAWLPRTPLFARVLVHRLPGWRKETVEGGTSLVRTFRPGGLGEALLWINYLAALLPTLAVASRWEVWLSPRGEAEVWVRDDEAETVTVDDSWTATLIDRAAALRRQRTGRLGRWRRALGRLVGRRPPRLPPERLEAELAAHPGWKPVSLKGGRRGVTAVFDFVAAEPALLFVNGCAAALGHLWEEMECSLVLRGIRAAAVLATPERDWPPLPLFHAVDWIDELAERLDGDPMDIRELDEDTEDGDQEDG